MRKTSVLLLVAGAVVRLCAQEAESGFTLPITFSAGALYTHRWDPKSPNSGPVQAGFRSMFYPSLKLGPHWFAYSAIQVNSSPYFYFEANSATNRVRTRVIQAFVGYTLGSKNKSVTVKAGQLASVFGSFPPRYDDTQNPLLDAPLSYGAADYGNYPVTLYGLPGVEVDASIGRVDARVQFTNSAPVNPKNLLSHGQYLNWAGGAGYSIRPGLRVGASLYHGPYLQVGRFLRSTENASEWPFTAVGLDAQLARGRWSLSGEWQRFHYLYPRYIQSPVLKYGYVEAKRAMSPRLYLAARAGYNTYSTFQRIDMPVPAVLRPNRQALELAAGYRLGRSQLLKIGYEWLHTNDTWDTRNNILGVQYVVSFDEIYKAFR